LPEENCCQTEDEETLAMSDRCHLRYWIWALKEESAEGGYIQQREHCVIEKKEIFYRYTVHSSCYPLEGGIYTRFHDH